MSYLLCVQRCSLLSDGPRSLVAFSSWPYLRCRLGAQPGRADRVSVQESQRVTLPPDETALLCVQLDSTCFIIQPICKTVLQSNGREWNGMKCNDTAEHKPNLVCVEFQRHRNEMQGASGENLIGTNWTVRLLVLAHDSPSPM